MPENREYIYIRFMPSRKLVQAETLVAAKADVNLNDPDATRIIPRRWPN